MMWEYVSIIFLGFAGFTLAAYLHHKKKRKTEHLVCPFKGNCSEVIQSDYSRFLGVPVELMGMGYYVFIALGYGAVLIWPSVFWLEFGLLIASSGAFLFSVYLTFIQFFNLKQLCTWCLLSATISTCIFAFSAFGSIQMVYPLLIEYRSFIIVAHVLFMALGLGAATMADVFFFRFLRDFRISQEENAVLSMISEFIWLILAGVVITGLALYVPEAARYNETPKFLVKAIVVGVIILNGAFLNFKVAPQLVKISFGKKHEHHEGELVRIRKIAFALGPISIGSWYSAFLLGMTPGSIPYSFVQIFAVYLLILAIGITFGQLYDQSLTRRAVKHS